MTLHDAIDLRASAPQSVEVTSRCGPGGDEVVHHTWFNGVASIPVFQTLPDRILTKDLARAAEPCRFEVTVNQGEGFRHGYLFTANVRDDQRGPVRIEGPGARVPERLQVSQLAGVHLRYANARPSRARLVCGDAQSAPLPFNQVLEVGSLDLRGGAEGTSKSPVQQCRFVVENAEEAVPGQVRREAMSNLITVQFSEGVWWLEPLPLAKQSGPLERKTMVTIADYLLHNLDDHAHILRSPKSEYMARIQIIYPNQRLIEDMRRPWIGVEVVEASGSQRFKGGLLRVLPNDPIRLRVKLYSEGSIDCSYAGLNVWADEAVFLEEIGKHDEVRASVQLPTPQPARVLFNPDAHANLFKGPYESAPKELINKCSLD